MNLIYRIALIFSFTFLIFQSKAQITVIPGWRENIKNSLNSINKSNSLRIDKDGNCYVLGTTWLTDSDKNIILIKFNPLGGEQWRRIYDNPTHGDDLPMNMCIDKTGNIWVCGMSKTGPGNADFLLVKFNSDGIPVDQLYDGKNHMFDCANSVVADLKGNVYAAGYETTLDSGLNMLLMKYSSDGTTLWKRTFSTRQMDVANQLVVDDSSNVYMCGTINNGPHSADMLIQKYDPEGRLKWQYVYDGVLSQSDAGQFISLDDSMNIYVSGFMNHANNRADIPLLKLNRNGKLLQENYYNGHIADCGAKKVNAYNNSVYITGGCDDYNISYNTTFFLEFDKAGNEKRVIHAPIDVTFVNSFEFKERRLLIGIKTTHPESTLIPFFSECDSKKITWSFADSTVYGLAHITHVEVKGNDIFFLGDDTGDATGTISILKYALKIPDIEKEKKIPSVKQKK